MIMSLMKKVMAEFLGTFWLVFRVFRVLPIIIAALICSSYAFAQADTTGVQPTGTSRTRAIQLPLSGQTERPVGSVTTTQIPTPGTVTSVNTINPLVEATGAFAGSAANRPFMALLSLREAVDRGIAYNLGEVGLTNAVRDARGQRKVVRSELLPNLNGYLSETVRQTNLQALGLRSRNLGPGISLPRVVGPFNYFDLRATLTQRVIDVTAWRNYGAAKEIVRATEQSVDDARDMVVLAVGGAYLQVIAAKARIDAARAQLETANTLYRQALEQRTEGVIAQTDLNRAQIQALTEEQRLITLENDLAKQKINLARLTGLEPDDQYDISDLLPFSPPPPMGLYEALRQAFGCRSDLKAAEAQVNAARKARDAARAERLPSFSIYADYGAIGVNPSQSSGTFAVVGAVTFPIWQGGRISGDIQRAEAALSQRRAELEDIKGEIESDVRNAFLDLQTSARQVEVARKNIQIAQHNLDLSRQRFDAGVTDNTEVVRSQEDVANANLDYINSLFAHNVAKLSLARATGLAAENLPSFLKMQ